MKPIRLIVGLGNPGDTYKETRHNIGFMLLDKLAQQEGFTFVRDRKRKAWIGAKDGVLFVKPDTYMNESGRAVGPLAHFFKLEPEQILVLQDEKDFDLGILKFKQGGSAGGHNGVKSLIAHLGTQNFPRLRFGIGQSSKKDSVEHVLGKFSPEERIILENRLDKALEAVQFVLSQGVELASNRYNANET